MHQHECGIFAGRFMVRLGRRRRDHFRSQSGRVLLSGRHRRSHRRTDITTNRIDATRESTSRIPRGPNNGLPSTIIMSWYARTETRIDTTRATTSCRPRGPCIWYAFYDNVVLYLVCTYVARIAEPIGGPQPKGREGRKGKTHDTPNGGLRLQEITSHRGASTQQDKQCNIVIKETNCCSSIHRP